MLKTETIQDIIVVRFDNVNRFNALIAEPVKEQLKEYFNKPKTKLILNLDNIDFVDSTGFGVFLSIMKTANNNYGFFKICNINAEVMELFKLLQLHNVFEIYGSLEDCVESFQ
ncbi:MAG: STAS domain-containing protein [Candidatus Heimdallarchaeota archaeon]|nr:STAS domain-containing protein [Candidatus Heimdallarchaeota archaeon]